MLARIAECKLKLIQILFISQSSEEFSSLSFRQTERVISKHSVPTKFSITSVENMLNAADSKTKSSVKAGFITKVP